jgi:putative membrane protein
VIAYHPPAAAFTWPWRQPLVLAGACLACVLYARGFARLRRRGRRDLASAARLAMFGSGIALAVLAVISPVDPIGERYLLSTHMLQHVAIGDAAPALLVAGLRGPIALFLLPRATLRAVAHRAGIRRWASALLNPAVALALWAAVYAGWHVPAAYDAALKNPALHDLEHASFFAAGLVVWTVLLEPFPRRRLAIRSRMGMAVVLLSLGNALSDALLLIPHPLYAAYAGQPVRLWGLSALADQRLAGAVMMVEQLASLTLCMAFLVRSERHAPAGRQPRQLGAMT